MEDRPLRIPSLHTPQTPATLLQPRSAALAQSGLCRRADHPASSCRGKHGGTVVPSAPAPADTMRNPGSSSQNRNKRENRHRKCEFHHPATSNYHDCHRSANNGDASIKQSLPKPKRNRHENADNRQLPNFHAPIKSQQGHSNIRSLQSQLGKSRRKSKAVNQTKYKSEQPGP